jgi:hypothetical protein
MKEKRKKYLTLQISLKFFQHKNFLYRYKIISIFIKLRKDYTAYINLETDGHEFKSVIAKSSLEKPKKPLEDDIDWNINDKFKDKQKIDHSIAEIDDSSDFF